jgi:hypothetical protein
MGCQIFVCHCVYGVQKGAHKYIVYRHGVWTWCQSVSMMCDAGSHVTSHKNRAMCVVDLLYQVM